jgi:hypothetical protein
MLAAYVGIIWSVLNLMPIRPVVELTIGRVSEIQNSHTNRREDAVKRAKTIG